MSLLGTCNVTHCFLFCTDSDIECCQNPSTQNKCAGMPCLTMRKTYKPLSRAEQTSQVYKKKTLAVTDELNIRKDEDNMDNVDEYWTTAASVIGNRTIDSIDDTIVSGSQSDTLFNLKNIRQSIKGSEEAGKKRLTLRLGDEDELVPAKHSNSGDVSAGDNDDDDSGTSTAIRENGGEETQRKTALPAQNEREVSQKGVAERVSDKHHRTTTMRQVSEGEQRESHKKNQLSEKPYRVLKKEKKKAGTTGLAENERQRELVQGTLSQKRSVPCYTEDDREDRAKKAMLPYPVYKYMPATPEEAKNDDPMEFDNVEEIDDISHQTADFAVSGDDISFQSVSTETKGVKASPKHMARNMRVYKSAKAESARKSGGKAAVAKSMPRDSQAVGGAAEKTVRSKSTLLKSGKVKKAAKESKKKDSGGAAEIISVSMFSERNKVKGLVCTSEIDTAVMDLDHMAYTKEEVAEKAFSIFVIKGILELIIEGKKGLMKKGDTTVVSEGCTYTMSSLSPNGTVLFLTYAL